MLLPAALSLSATVTSHEIWLQMCGHNISEEKETSSSEQEKKLRCPSFPSTLLLGFGGWIRAISPESC